MAVSNPSPEQITNQAAIEEPEVPAQEDGEVIEIEEESESGEVLLASFIEVTKKKLKESEDKQVKRYKELYDRITKIRAIDTNPVDYMESDGFKTLVKEVADDMEKETVDEEQAIVMYGDFIMELKNDFDRKEARVKYKERLQSMTGIERARAKKQHKKDQALIKKLHKEMLVHTKKLDRLQAKELTMDEFDLADSSYIKGEKLQKRICNLFKKIKELEGNKMKLGRLIEKKFHYKGSGHEDVDKAISKAVTKWMERSHAKKGLPRYASPDYVDIVEVIESTKKGKNLSTLEVKKIFEEIVTQIQKRRLIEERDALDSIIHDEGFGSEAPAPQDPELLAKLAENDKIKKSLTEVFDDFKRKQEEMGANAEAVESDVQNDDEIEDEDSEGDYEMREVGDNDPLPDEEEDEEDEEVQSDTMNNSEADEDAKNDSDDELDDSVLIISDSLVNGERSRLSVKSENANGHALKSSQDSVENNIRSTNGVKDGPSLKRTTNVLAPSLIKRVKKDDTTKDEEPVASTSKEVVKKPSPVPLEEVTRNSDIDIIDLCSSDDDD